MYSFNCSEEEGGHAGLKVHMCLHAPCMYAAFTIVAV